MVVLAFALVLTFGVYAARHLSIRSRPDRWGWHDIWRLACVIAALRVAALWFGTIGLRRPDWLQGLAYLVLMLDLPEIYLFRGARADPYRWASFGSLILTATSLGWAAAFTWFRNRRVNRIQYRGRPQDS